MLLQTSALRQKAWGAFLTGGLHDPALTQILVDQLRAARQFAAAARESEEYAYTQALLDALIVLKAHVPTDVVEPFRKDRTPECLILLAQSDPDEAPLMAERDESIDIPARLLLNNMLFRMRSGSFLLKMIREVAPRHYVRVLDPPGHYASSGPHPIGAGDVPDLIYRFPRAFPPIGIYRLTARRGGMWDHSPGTGDVLINREVYSIYYRRFVIPTDGSVQIPGDRDYGPDDRVAYLAAAAGMTTDEVRLLFDHSTFVLSNELGTLQSSVEKGLATQEAGIRQLVENARRAGFKNITPLEVRILVELVDHRQSSHDPLPKPSDYQFTIN